MLIMKGPFWFNMLIDKCTDLPQLVQIFQKVDFGGTKYFAILCPFSYIPAVGSIAQDVVWTTDINQTIVWWLEWRYAS